MAKGDIVGCSAAVAAAGVMSYQPAAGIEVVVLHVGTSSKAADINVRLYDEDGARLVAFGANTAHFVGKLMISNRFSLDVKNDNAGAMNLGMSGVQVK